MSLVELLYSRKRDGKSIRSILAAFGVAKWSDLSRPLELLPEEQVIALLYSWTLRELRPGETIKLRIIDEYTFGIYEVTLKARKGCIYVTEIYPRPDLQGQRCYYWPVDFNMEALTPEAIKASMDTADDMLELEISEDEEIKRPRYVRP